jgi:hypothetical protein
MKTALVIALFVIGGIAATAAVSVAQLDFPVRDLLSSPDLEAAGELPAGLDASPGTAASGASDEPQPRAVVDETEFDFGFLPNSSTDHRHSFVIKNEGTAPLKLLRSDVSCNKCTFANLPAEPIPPGGSAAVQVRWNINLTDNVFRQHVDVHTNDREHPLLRLIITGKVVHPFAFEPKALVFSNLRVGESAEATAVLFAYFSDQLKVSEHAISNPDLAGYFDVELTELTPGELPKGVKSATKIHVTVKPGLPLGAFKQRILLKTNLEDGAEQELSVSGNISGPVSVVGKGWNQEHGILSIGQVKQSQGAKRNLTLVVRGKEFAGLALESAKVKPDLLKVTYGKVNQVGDGATNLAPIEIEIPPGAPPVNHMGSDQGKPGEIIVRFNNAGLPPVKLLVQFAVVED